MSHEIAARLLQRLRARQAIGARYLRDNIKYDLGDEERAGLELFYRYAAEVGRREERAAAAVLLRQA